MGTFSVLLWEDSWPSMGRLFENVWLSVSWPFSLLLEDSLVFSRKNFLSSIREDSSMRRPFSLLRKYPLVFYGKSIWSFGHLWEFLYISIELCTLIFKFKTSAVLKVFLFAGPMRVALKSKQCKTSIVYIPRLTAEDTCVRVYLPLWSLRERTDCGMFWNTK